MLGLSFLTFSGLWLFRDPLRNRLAQSAVLANPAPPPELVEEIIAESKDHPAAILAAWNSGKIVHREAAMREISRAFPLGRPLSAELESIVLTGSLDPDMNVRETALGILRDRNHPALASLAVAQLQDPDPQVRLLGLNYLKRNQASTGVAAVMPLLDENDPLIVATALKLLENWSGENFGVKLRDTASSENPTTGLKEFPDGSRELAKAGAARAKTWWKAHQAEIDGAQTRLQVPPQAIAARIPVPAADFSLRDLKGQKIRLSDLRGKVVLINFWTTWCPACLSEMPEIIALQTQHADRLVIIGVSLDFVPDSHGHIGGHPAVEEQGRQVDKDPDERSSRALNKVREKVARTVKARGINYTILLDEANEVGGRFNGGELPTTVIVDADGNVRRRFVGARSLEVFEAMIAEASQPERRAFDKSPRSTQQTVRIP